MTDKALVPIAQKQVSFYEDEITAVLAEAEQGQEVYVSIRQLCDLLGVSYQGQMRRINDDPVLSRQVKGVNITFTPSGGRGGGPQTTNCLPLDYLNGWLFGINARRVREEVRERLILYQEKCYRTLAEAFREGRLSTEVDLDALLQTSDSDAAQAYRLLQAMARLARQQVFMEAQLGEQAVRLDAHDRQLAGYGERLEEIEATLGDPGQHVTPDQAMQISQAVKLVALELGKRSKKNEYGAVYGQFYREFGITSYKQLPAAQFDRAMAWLTDWYRRVTGATPPGEAPW